MVKYSDKEKLKGEFIVPEYMDAAFLTKPLEVKVLKEKVPKVGSKDVLVKIGAVGICGSDIHYYAHGHIGERVVQYPHIQGHECAGVIVAIGDKVTRFKVGDRVAVEPGVSCMACEWCKEGRYNLCPDVQFLSTPPVKGAFVQYLSHREDFLYPIPDTLSFELATLAEPLSVGIHAVKRGNLKPNSTVLITGMGPVGLMAIVAAKSFGANQIIVTDMEPFRLEAAKKLGATNAIDISDSDVSQMVSRLTGGHGVDMVIETSGNEKALESSVKLTRRGGTIVAVGFPPANHVPLNITHMLQNEIDLLSVYRYINTYPTAIEILNQVGNEVEHIITDKYTIYEIQEAMNQSYKNKEKSLKVMVYPNTK
ncbi:NAD(P)-dependent alcohol dehydrogenase [Pseudogracilibacillus auburnensis]|uniref:NAD(P)-dependent alcohol dehydrogenase n=1 Tax=Pseudogracilibacillus auburnensis TaxID=1494959 RepID=UPI001A96DC8C|nr:NAD(P)-dependent alcohol dehydrogenase [Pseudogracilibacillus auburnensis]MBO1002643.1 NAD(P)-dependent alcohol dehydrogenase [Pseudogracilibacillus auburnensis]